MIRSIRPMLIACLSLSLSLTAVACGGDDDGGDDGSGTPDAGGDDDPADVEVLPASDCTDPAATISTDGRAFVGGDVTISVGDTVLATPGAGHDLKAPEFDTGALGAAACLRFNVAGDFDYVCSAHADMTGTITVE